MDMPEKDIFYHAEVYAYISQAAKDAAQLVREQTQDEFRAFWDVLNSHGEKIDALTTKVDKLQDTVSGHTFMINHLMESMDKMVGRQDGFDTRMDKLDGRMDKLEGTVSKLDSRIGRMEVDVAGLKKEVGVINVKLTVMDNKLTVIDKKVSVHERKLAKA